MSIARKVLMIVGFIASIVITIVLAICAVAFFIASGNEEMLNKILDGLNRSSMSVSDGKIYVIALASMFTFWAIIEVINALIAIKGVKSNRTGLMVLNIIFGVLSGVYVNSLGGIFGLVESKKQ